MVKSSDNTGLSTPHILGIATLTRDDIFKILDLAKKFKTQKDITPTLKNKSIVNLFFEPSTRTRISFETAAKRLGGSIINIAASQSSLVKGETLIDTARNIEAMKADIIIMRHHSSGAPVLLSKILKTPIINAGDGLHEHPSQALLDMMTILEHKGPGPEGPGPEGPGPEGYLSGLKVLIVGDIAHSRVARSNIFGLRKMGAKVFVCGPPTLIPPYIEKCGVCVSYDFKRAIRDMDVIMMTRIQTERQDNLHFPTYREYIRHFGLNSQILKDAKKDVIIMHPGPLNRGIEITPEVADGPYSVILDQVSNGVLIRMALLELLTREKHVTH